MEQPLEEDFYLSHKVDFSLENILLFRVIICRIVALILSKL